MATYQEKFKQNYEDVNNLTVLAYEVIPHYLSNPTKENYQLLSDIDDRIQELK